MISAQEKINFLQGPLNVSFLGILSSRKDIVAFVHNFNVTLFQLTSRSLNPLLSSLRMLTVLLI